ncbi:MAG: prolipoprotein diacylglyceryl transferase family protein [Candidatus Limnocylindrales bacterium]
MLDIVRLDFDPTIALVGLTVRLETLALAGVILLTLVMAALGAGRMRSRLVASAEGPRPDAARLRRDDLILIAFGAVPGAVVGGRLGYGLVHLDYYSGDPSLLTDPARGGLSLTLAVVLGTVSGLAVALLLAAPIARWLHVASGPLLIGLGLGKLAMVLGGTGQGQFSNASWATEYARPGPWGSLVPADPALPSQALEGGLVLFAAALLVLVPFLLRLRLRRWQRIVRPALAPRREWLMLTGFRRFLTALSLWAVARFAAGFTWRDAQVVGPLRAEQLVLIGVLAGCAAILLVAGLWQRRRRRQSTIGAAADAEAALPEPRFSRGAAPAP